MTRCLSCLFATVDHLNQMMSSLLAQNTSLSSQLYASKKRKSATVGSEGESEVRMTSLIQRLALIAAKRDTNTPVDSLITV